MRSDGRGRPRLEQSRRPGNTAREEILDATRAIYRVAGICEDITDAKLQDLSIRRLSRIHRVLSGTNSAIVRIHDRDSLLDEACRIAVEEGGFPIAWDC